MGDILISLAIGLASGLLLGIGLGFAILASRLVKPPIPKDEFAKFKKGK